jgi:hypothetical protein
MSNIEWVVKHVVRPTDLRTVKWQAASMHSMALQYKLQPGQAVLFINKKGDKSRVLVRLSNQIEGLLMMPVDPHGDVWGDPYNAASLAGDWLHARMATSTNKTSTFSKWLDEMAHKSTKYTQWKKRRK